MIEIQPGYCIMWQQGLYIVQGTTFFPYLINEYFVSILHNVGPELMHTAEMPYMTCMFYRVTYFVIHFFFSFAGHTSRYIKQCVPMYLLRFMLR